MSHDTGAHCEACGRPLGLHEAVRGTTCLDPECRRKAVVRRDAEEREQAARARIRRAEAFAADFAWHQRIGGPLLVVPVPAWDGRPVPRPATRRESLRRHLLRLLRSLRAPADPAPPAHEEPSPGIAEARALGTGCAACRGNCCRTGGDTAWLDREAIARTAAARPDLRRRGLLALYLDHLPGESIEESCVYHGDSGCVLPRDMRADVCNRWFCDDLLGFRARLASGERGTPVFVAALRGTPRRARAHRPLPGGMLSGTPSPEDAG